MHSLTITEKTTQSDLMEFKIVSGVEIKFHNRTCDLRMAVDYGDTIHAEVGRVLVEKGKADG
jgi:hypothetical protein